MQTFLDCSRDENGNEVSFAEFQRSYPIYDFGQNHRSMAYDDTRADYIEGISGHDDYIKGLSPSGFVEMKKHFKEILREYGIEYEYNAEHKVVPPKKKQLEEEQMGFFESITDYTRSARDYRISDMSRLYGYIAKYKEYGGANIRKIERSILWKTFMLIKL